MSDTLNLMRKLAGLTEMGQPEMEVTEAPANPDQIINMIDAKIEELYQSFQQFDALFEPRQLNQVMGPVNQSFNTFRKTWQAQSTAGLRALG
jgi:hypothetical protein